MSVPDYAQLARRSSDETLQRLLEQHQAAEEQAHQLWCMHMEITTAILAEQNRRITSPSSQQGRRPHDWPPENARAESS